MDTVGEGIVGPRVMDPTVSQRMDEQPVQLVQETRPPIAATKERPRRVDYEYERAGTASVFLFSSPPGGAGPAYS